MTKENREEIIIILDRGQEIKWIENIERKIDLSLSQSI